MTCLEWVEKNWLLRTPLGDNHTPQARLEDVVTRPESAKKRTPWRWPPQRRNKTGKTAHDRLNCVRLKQHHICVCIYVLWGSQSFSASSTTPGRQPTHVWQLGLHSISVSEPNTFENEKATSPLTTTSTPDRFMALFRLRWTWLAVLESLLSHFCLGLVPHQQGNRQESYICDHSPFSSQVRLNRCRSRSRRTNPLIHTRPGEECKGLANAETPKKFSSHVQRRQNHTRMSDPVECTVSCSASVTSDTTPKSAIQRG